MYNENCVMNQFSGTRCAVVIVMLVVMLIGCSDNQPPTPLKSK